MIERRWAFVGAIIGIFVLLLIMVLGGEERVASLKEIEELEINTKVIIIGGVVSERKFGEGVMLELDNGIEVLCDSCDFNLEGEEIEVMGKVYDFYGEKRVLAYRIVAIE